MNAYVLVSRKSGNSRNLGFCIAPSNVILANASSYLTNVQKTKQIFEHRTSTFQAGMMPVYILNPI